ncbi:3499_t:CDS:1 [Paraglomus brasilianum]|uniref:3499_t:CDS:1 n=1 Tax=Paraglomus brasilianum TaxID=144538 RepID=A0A9N9CAM9_9GLOM|nr:3499_t:CDS:1 [Paraglomus brasilianum]
MVVWQPNNSMLTEDPSSTTTNTVDMEDKNTLKDSHSESLGTTHFNNTEAERKKTAEKLFGNSSADISPAVEDTLDCNINTLSTITDKATDIKDTTDMTNNNSTTAISVETVGTHHLTDTISEDSQVSLIETHIPEEHRLSKESRFSKESGMVSSASSSINDGDNETDAQQPSSLTSQLSTTNNDQYTRTFTDNSNKHLGIITEEEETKSILSNHSQDVSNYAPESIENNSEKQNITTNVREEHFLTSDQADTETRLSGSSPTASDISETPLSSNQLPVEAKRRSSSKRKNSTRSIFSVLSPSIRSSSSSTSTRDSSRGSFSDTEGDPVPRKQQQHSVLSKADRILGRSPFGSISARRRTSRMLNASESEVTPPGSPNSPEKLSKIGKILGLTPSEEKLLLEKPDVASQIFQLSSSSSSSLDEKSAKPKKSEADNRPVNTSNKANKVLGLPVDNGMPVIDEKSKAGKILGLEEKVQKRRGTSMYVSRVSDRVSGLVVHSRVGISSPITVATVNKNIALTGTLTKYQHVTFGKSWKRRFFILAKTTLYCFKDSERSSLMTDSFEITAETTVCVTDAFSGKQWMLQVNKEGTKPWYLQADNVEDMKLWLAELKATVVKCKYSVTQLPEVPTHKTIDEPVNNIHNTPVPAPRRIRQSPPTVASSSQGIASTISPSYIQQSLPPPPRPAPSAPANITSLPPPPRPKSAPTTSCPPSPTPSLPPSRPLSPQHDPDVAELAGANIGAPARPSSPVHTLSPPKTRTAKIMVRTNNNNIPREDIDSVVTTPTSVFNPAKEIIGQDIGEDEEDEEEEGSTLSSSINLPYNAQNTDKSQKSVGTTYSLGNPPVMPSRPLRTMTPPAGLFSLNHNANRTVTNTTTQPPKQTNQTTKPKSTFSSISNSSSITDSYTSLPPPPRSPPPPRTATRSPILSTPQPPRSSRSPHPPRSPPVVYAFNQQYYNIHSTPPSTPPRSPVAVSPPRSTAVVGVSNVATKRRIPPNLSLSNSSHPSPPSPRSPHSTHSAPSSPYYYTSRSRKATDSPPFYSTRSPTPPARIMNIPTSLSSALAPTVPHPPGPPRFSKPTSSQSRSIQPSNKLQYQSIPIILPSSAITSIPPPPRTRPPNIPLPSIPTNVRPRNLNGKNIRGVEPAVEFSDDDELDPDYRDEVNAAWRKSQLTKSLEEKHNKRHRNAARVSKRHRDINGGTDDTHRVDSDVESNESDVHTNHARALNRNFRRVLIVHERMSSGDFELVASVQELDKISSADDNYDDDGYAVKSVDEGKMGLDEADSVDIYLNGVVDVKTKISGYESDGSLIDPMDSVDDSTRWASSIF